jgi:hypothetical protein
LNLISIARKLPISSSWLAERAGNPADPDKAILLRAACRRADDHSCRSEPRIAARSSSGHSANEKLPQSFRTTRRESGLRSSMRSRRPSRRDGSSEGWLAIPGVRDLVQPGGPGEAARAAEAPSAAEWSRSS